MNQCDGCMAGIPLVNGLHRMGKEGGYSDPMSCTKKLYESKEHVGGWTWYVRMYKEVHKVEDVDYKALLQQYIKGVSHEQRLHLESRG